MDFGFTLKPDHSLERIASLTRLAETAGFKYGWLFDSHVLWKETYVLLRSGAEHQAVRSGLRENPATREPSVTASVLAVLQELAGGRMDLGIGRGTRRGAFSARSTPTSRCSRRPRTLSAVSARVARSRTKARSAFRLDRQQRLPLDRGVRTEGARTDGASPTARSFSSLIKPRRCASDCSVMARARRDATRARSR